MSEIIHFLLHTLWPLVLSVGAVLLLFGGTVLVHELGHFLTAKWFGLRIDAFSIGMGPAIWQKKINGVVYKIAWLPIGGYVALPQMDITGSAFENEDARDGKLTEVAPWKRIVIAVAGPFMNVVAAFVLAVIIWQVGKQPDPGFQDPVVGEIFEDGPAYQAGLRQGDRIYMVNDDKTTFWVDVQMAAMLNPDIDLKIIRDGEILNLENIPTSTVKIGDREIRMLDGIEPQMPPVVGVAVRNFVEGSAAFEAGMEPGDQILQVNGEKVTGPASLIKRVNADVPHPLKITYSRKGKESTLDVTPLKDEESGKWMIGVIMKPVYVPEHPAPLRQLNYFKGQIFRTLVAFTRSNERGRAAGSVGGPVLIFSSMHSQIKDSVMTGLWFTALININLAILNLLPLIILDGGHIMVALFEIVTGRKLYRKLILTLANIMVVFLIGIMVFFTFRDSLFIYDLNKKDPPEAAESLPTPEATGLPAESASDTP